MYPHHVFDLEPAGTFGMYPICYRQVSGRYFQPEPAMYSKCFRWFPGSLAPSVQYYGEVKECSTVLPAEDLVPNSEPKEDSNPGLVRTFQSAVGQLMYLMMATRHNITYTVGILARHASNPSNQHIAAIVYLAGYLMKTKQWCLTYRWQEKMRNGEINGHVRVLPLPNKSR